VVQCIFSHETTNIRRPRERAHTHIALEKQETIKKAKKAQQDEHKEFLRHFSEQKSAIRSPPRVVKNIPPRDKMSASPASYNVTLATLRTTSPSRSTSRKQVRQQTEKEKRRARLLKKLEIVALRERGFAAHNVRFLNQQHYPLFKINLF
jgi:uncharacterized protein YkwD